MIANHEIERAVLALIVQHQDASTLERLDGDLFDAKQHRTLYDTLLSLHLAELPFDEPTLVTALTRERVLADAGGKAGVSALYYHDTAHRANLDAYLAQLRDASARRYLADGLLALAREAETSEDSLDALTARIETAVLDRTRRHAGAAVYIDAATMASDAIQLIDAASKRGDGLVGLDSGIPALNDLIGGWEPGTLTVLMGDPGVGKTALWLQSALHVSRSWPIAMVQLEMTPAKMGIRALANQAGISFRRLRRGDNLTEGDYKSLSEQLGNLALRRIMLAPRGINEWKDIKGFWRRCVIDHEARALFLDNVKIVSMPRAKNDLDRFTTIFREMKLMAHELNVPIIAIHHLHRPDRPGSRPTLQSGYGASSIEQDADNVLALWRPDAEAEEEIEILPLKTRDDLARPQVLRWQGEYQRFGTFKPDTPTLPYN